MKCLFFLIIALSFCVNKVSAAPRCESIYQPVLDQERLFTELARLYIKIQTETSAVVKSSLQTDLANLIEIAHKRTGLSTPDLIKGIKKQYIQIIHQNQVLENEQTQLVKEKIKEENKNLPAIFEEIFSYKGNIINAQEILGKYIYIFRNGQSGQILDLKTLQIVHEFKQNFYFSEAVVSPDQKFILLKSGTHLHHVYKVGTWEEVQSFYFNNSSHIDHTLITQDSQSIIYINEHQIEVRSLTQKDTLLKVIPNPSGIITSIKLSPDGSLFFVCSHTGNVDIYSTRDWSLLKTIHHGPPTKASLISADNQILVTADFEGNVKITQTQNWQLLHSFKFNDFSPGVSLSMSDDKRFIAARTNANVNVIDTLTWKSVYSSQFNNRTLPVFFAPNTKERPFMVSVQNQKTWVIDLTSGKALAEIGHGESVDSVQITSDGRYLITSAGSKGVFITEVGTWLNVHKITHGSIVRSSFLTTNNKYIITFSVADGSLKITEIKDQKN